MARWSRCWCAGSVLLFVMLSLDLCEARFLVAGCLLVMVFVVEIHEALLLENVWPLAEFGGVILALSLFPLIGFGQVAFGHS